MKKILIITYYWPPAGGAGVQRWLKFSKYLPEYGYTPIILTVNENYANYPQIDTKLENEISNNLKIHKTKTFEIFSIYQKLISNKEMPYGGFANENNPSLLKKIARFIRGNFFIPDPRKGWNKYAYKKALEIIKNNNIDTIITTSPPHSTQLIGLKLKKKTNIKWIADIRDPWTEIYYNKEFYKTSFANKLDYKYEQQVINNADKVIVVSNSIKQAFSKNKKELLNKINIISNGFDTDDIIESSNSNNNKINIVYTGTISDIYPMNIFIDAIKLLSNKNISIKLVGQVNEIFKQKIETEKLTNIFEFVGQVSHEESLEYLSKADIALLLIPEIKDNKGILTGKFFEYLGSKKIILAIGPSDGDVAKIIKKTNSGEMIEYNDINSIINFINNFNNNKYSFEGIKEYSRKELTNKLIKLLN